MVLFENGVKKASSHVEQVPPLPQLLACWVGSNDSAGLAANPCSLDEPAFRVQSGLRTILQEGTLQPRTQMLIQNFFSAVSYGVLDPESAKEKARLKQQEENRRLGFPDRPVHGLPPRIPVGLDLVDSNDARCV